MHVKTRQRKCKADVLCRPTLGLSVTWFCTSFCYVLLHFNSFCHYLFKVLPLGRAFAETGNVSVRLPVVSLSPLSLHGTLSSAWGDPQQLHHLPGTGMLAMEGVAGVYQAHQLSCAITITFAESTVGSSVTTSGRVCGFTLDPSGSVRHRVAP